MRNVRKWREYKIMKKYLSILIMSLVLSLSIQPELDSMNMLRGLWTTTRDMAGAACTTGKFTYDVGVIGKNALSLLTKVGLGVMNFEGANFALIKRLVELMSEHKHSEHRCPLAKVGLVGWESTKIALWVAGNLLLHVGVLGVNLSLTSLVILLVMAAILTPEFQKRFAGQSTPQIPDFLKSWWNRVVLEKSKDDFEGNY